ncbi:MAG: hypothetical protein ACI4RA_00665, partial [Kiritimatiellia bacterium]
MRLGEKIMRRILTLIAAIMGFGSVFAADVAQVGSNTYPTLKEAVDAARAQGNGATITLLADYAIPSVGTAEEAEKAHTSYLLPENGVLDLDTHTLTVPYLSAMFEGKNITIKNGTFTTPDAHYALWIGAGKNETSATIENVKSDAGANVGHAQAKFINCEFDASSRNYYAVWADNEADVTIESGIYKAKNRAVWDVVTSPEHGTSATVSITGGTYSSDISQYIPSGTGLGALKKEDGSYEVGYATNWIQLADVSWYDDLNKDNDTFRLRTPEQLAGLAKLVNEGNTFAGKQINVDETLDLGCYNKDGRVVEWTPIGVQGHPFMGNFAMFNDGVVIKNMMINEPTKDNQALFGFVDGWPTFERVVLENVDVTGKGSVAGLIGEGAVGTINDCVVKGSVNIAGMNGGSYAAAIFAHGYVNDITDCSVIGSEDSSIKSTSQAGGIAGFTGESLKAFGVKIQGCHVEGIHLEADKRTGAIAASVQYGGAVMNCSAKNVTMTSGSAGDNGLLVGRTMGRVPSAPEGITEGVLTYVINNTIENVAGVEKDGAQVMRIHGFNNGEETVNKQYAVTGTGVVLDENNLVIMADKLVYGYDETGAHSHLAEGSTATEHPDNDGTWVVKGKVVAMIGGRGYSTLQAAFDAAVDGDTVKLAAEVKSDNAPGWPIRVTNKAGAGQITLDLNGQTISGNNKTSPASITALEGDLPGIILASGAGLILTDTVGNGKIANEASNGHTIVAAALDDTGRATQITLQNGVCVETKCYATWSTTTADSK